MRRVLTYIHAIYIQQKSKRIFRKTLKVKESQSQLGYIAAVFWLFDSQQHHLCLFQRIQKDVKSIAGASLFCSLWHRTVPFSYGWTDDLPYLVIDNYVTEDSQPAVRTALHWSMLCEWFVVLTKKPCHTEGVCCAQDQAIRSTLRW